MSLWEEIEEAARAGETIQIAYAEEADVYVAWIGPGESGHHSGEAASVQEAVRDAVGLWQESVRGPGRTPNFREEEEDDDDGDEDVDVVVSKAGGNLFMFTPMTDGGTVWIQEKVDKEAMFIGESLMVEHRYAIDLANAMIDDGLKVRN